MDTPTIDRIYLYRITHIDNIPHILKHGIVGKDSVNANSNYISIGDPSLIGCREEKEVTIKGDNKSIILGNFIPFYFGVRMPMLYVIQHGFNCIEKPLSPEEIVYLAIPLIDIINSSHEYYFSDGHGVDFFTNFYDKSNINSLPSIIDWDAVTASQWSGEGIDTDLRRKKQAEFLIKEDISPEFIKGFVCYNAAARNKLISFSVNEKQIKIYPKAYY